MIIKKRISIIIVLCAFHFSIQAQSTKQQVIYPKVGKPCPDFVLHNIKYFPLKQARLKNFQGKWLVLDFWDKHCGACISSFPKVSAMQNEFGSKVQFMMVGIDDREKEIEPMYAKYRVRENLLMPCAFDSLLAIHFDISAVPHIYVIDNLGIVRGVTNSLNRDQIRAFLEGGQPELAPSYGDPADTVDHTIPFVEGKPFLLNGNGGIDTDFMFRSVLSRFNLNKQHQFVPQRMGESVKDGRFQVLGVPLFWLFNYAYFGVPRPGSYGGDSTYGKYQNFPILEIKDSSVFLYSWIENKNLFAYSLIMPPDRSSVVSLQKAMQNDLQHYFDCEVKIEFRKCACWRLIATEEAKKKLKAKGGSFSFRKTKSGFIAKDFPFSSFLNNIFIHFDNEIIFDETGIEGKIDIAMLEDTWITIQDARKSLQTSGLDLIPDEREMKVLVIQDIKVNPIQK